jgi:hypothetical protein
MATLVLRRPALGNLAVHDFRASVNVRALTPDFNRLTIDPYVRDGYRRKHLVRYRCVQQRSPTAPLLMAVLPLAPLLQPCSDRTRATTSASARCRAPTPSRPATSSPSGSTTPASATTASRPTPATTPSKKATSTKSTSSTK